MSLILKILDILAFSIGLIGVGIIYVGVIQAFIFYILRKKFWDTRLILVKHILLGLDFLIARDIIETVILKTEKTLWIDLAALVLIIIIRVVFSYFTSREMQQIEEEGDIFELKRNTRNK